MERNNKAYTLAITKLDRAMKKARAEHKAAIAKLNEAQDKVAACRNYSDRDAEQHLKKMQAQYELNHEKDTFKQTVNSIWSEFDSTAAQARRELLNALEDADTLHAADLDTAAVALLNSGTMRPKDYQAMAADFSENATVLALVRKAAKEAADKMISADQSEARSALYAVAREAQTSGQTLVKEFDSLLSAARIAAGRTPDGGWRDTDRLIFTTSLDTWEAVTADIIPSEE